MLWWEQSEALKKGETIVLVHVVADVDGRLDRNFGKDAAVLETFIMYTLGTVRLKVKPEPRLLRPVHTVQQEILPDKQIARRLRKLLSRKLQDRCVRLVLHLAQLC